MIFQLLLFLLLQAEAELLSAIVTFFTKLGITSNDVGIKVSNRKVCDPLLYRTISSKHS